MGSDNCLVFPDRIVFIACGKKLMVVRNAAEFPSKFVRSIALIFLSMQSSYTLKYCTSAELAAFCAALTRNTRDLVKINDLF